MAAENIPNLTGYTLDGGRYKLIEMLGSGAYGVVYRAEAATPGSAVPAQRAIKIIRKRGNGKTDNTTQRREISLHKLASAHPNVVTLHETFEDPDYFYLVLDFCPGGDLFHLITDKRAFERNDAHVKKVFLQIVDAVHACHRQKVYHRDLKPENILCNKDGSQIYLADFGLATSRAMSYTHACGSSFYMSPECIGEQSGFAAYSTKHSDLWALGIILINMVTGRNAWEYARLDDPLFEEYTREDDWFYITLPISRGAADILRRLMALDATARISLRELRSAVLALDTFFMSPEEEAELAARDHMFSPTIEVHSAAETKLVDSLLAEKPPREIEEVDIGDVKLLRQAYPPRPKAPLGRPMQEGTEDSVDLSSDASSVFSSGPTTPAVVAHEPDLEIVDCEGLGAPLVPLPIREDKEVSAAARLLQRLEMIVRL